MSKLHQLYELHVLTLWWRPLLPYGYSCEGSCVRPS